jgi:transcriptional regulator with XRE-family HTH domain
MKIIDCSQGGANMQHADIGTRIRKFRERQALSAQQLAQRSGLDAEFIRAMEEDNVTPSLGPLLKVARALEYAFVIAEHGLIEPSQLPDPIANRKPRSPAGARPSQLQPSEKKIALIDALRQRKETSRRRRACWA